MNRTAAYSWLASRMGIAVEDCHIGRFDYEQCELVIKIMKPFKAVEAKQIKQLWDSSSARKQQEEK
jgi:hypothetical protein